MTRHLLGNVVCQPRVNTPIVRVGLGALFLLLIISTPWLASSQVNEEGFPKQAGSLGSDQGRDVVSDSQRNIYTIGIFQDRTEIDDMELISAGQFDIYLVKYNPNSDLQWVNQIGSTGNDIAYGIAADNSNNIYITGEYSGTVSFNDEDNTRLTSVGSSDIFVAKYNSNGDLQWAVSAGGTNSDNAQAIAIDDEGNGVITGSFKGTVRFDNLRVLGPSDRTSGYVAKFNTNGRFIWVEHIAGTGSLTGSAIGVDNQENIYVTGRYSGMVTINEASVVSKGENDVFVARLDTDGELDWVETLGSTANDGVNDIAVEANGDLYLTGFFEADIELGTITLEHVGDRDIFVFHYNANGNGEWAVSAGSGGSDEGTGISLSGGDAVVVTGNFERTWLLDGNLLESQGDSDIFIFRYLRDDGELDWVRTAGGPGSDSARAIFADANDVSLVTGFFSDTAEFDGVTLTAVGGFDCFVVRYDEFGFLLP